MSEIEILNILEDKVKHLVTDLKKTRKMSQSTEIGTLALTDKLAKIELKVKKTKLNIYHSKIFHFIMSFKQDGKI